MQQQGLRFQLRCLVEHWHQHSVLDLCKGVGAGAPVAAPALLLSFWLQLASVDALSAAHRYDDGTSSSLLIEATGPLGHVPLLDPQRQRGAHCWTPDRDRSPVVASLAVLSQQVVQLTRGCEAATG